MAKKQKSSCSLKTMVTVDIFLLTWMLLRMKRMFQPSWEMYACNGSLRIRLERERSASSKVRINRIK